MAVISRGYRARRRRSVRVAAPRTSPPHGPCSISCPAPSCTQNTATSSAMRRAWARLCVTITTRVLAAQRRDQVLDDAARDRVERAARLVHQQHLGFEHQRARQAEPLLLPAGERQRRRVEPVLAPRPRGPTRRSAASASASAPRRSRMPWCSSGNVEVAPDRQRERVRPSGRSCRRGGAARPRRRARLVDVAAVERDPAVDARSRGSGRSSG